MSRNILEELAAEVVSIETALEQAAKICRMMTAGGHVWSEEQRIAANALLDAAASIDTLAAHVKEKAVA